MWGTDIFCFPDLGNYRWYSFLIKKKVLCLFQILLGMQKCIFLLTILIWLVVFHIFFPLILKVFSTGVSNSSLSLFPSSCNLWPLSRSSLCIITINLTLSMIKFYLLPMQRTQCHPQNTTDSKYRPPRRRKGRQRQRWGRGKERSWSRLNWSCASMIFHKTG